MAADMTLATITGSIQKYFDRKTMTLPMKTYETPLASMDNGLPGQLIGKGKGQAVQFRFFDNVEPTKGNNDSPKLYDDSTDVSTEAMTATSYIVPLGEISHGLSFGPLLLDTDPSNLMELGHSEMVGLVKRYIHRITNDRMVYTNATYSDPNSLGLGSAPSVFPTIFAGRLPSFADMVEGSVHTLKDIERTVSALRNSRVPKFSDGYYHSVISDSIKQQYMQENTRFYDVVKRHEDLAKTVYQRNILPVWNNVKFFIQDDEYRCNLPNASGALATRKDTGRVQVAHVFGKGGYGFLELSGKKARGVRPRFKTQDISVSGINITTAFRMPFNAAVIRPDYGVNIAGTTNFYEDIDDF